MSPFPLGPVPHLLLPLVLLTPHVDQLRVLPLALPGLCLDLVHVVTLALADDILLLLELRAIGMDVGELLLGVEVDVFTVLTQEVGILTL